MTSSSPGGALPARHSSLKTHTHSPGNGLYQHTQTPGEITNTDADTQAQTRMQGNGPHQRQAAGVCANANTHKHTLQNSYKPEITWSVHVNLTPPQPSLHSDWKEALWDMQGYPLDPYLWSQRASLTPPERLSQPEGHPTAGLGELDGQKGPWDTGGRRQERTLGA